MTDSKLTPYDWQQADIDKSVRVMREGPGSLITSAPGAGKTVVAVEIARELGAKSILVIAPQGTHLGAWGRTFARQGVADEVRTLIGTAKGKAAFADLKWGFPGVYITTPQWFARQNWKGINPDMVIFDEIHWAGAYGIATSKKLLQLSHIKYRLGLSGTPLRNKFENAWSLVSWIEPQKLGGLDYWVWRLTKCATKPSPFAPQGREVTGEKVPGELFGSLSCFIYHSQRERCCSYHPQGFLAHLPEPLKLDVVTEMTAAQATFYKRMENTLAASLLTEDGDEMHVNAEQFIVARGYLRRCALGLPSVDTETEKLYFPEDTPSPKLDRLIEDLPSYEGRHTLVLTASKQFAKVTVDRIAAAGYTVEGWHGDVSKTKRNKTLASFTSGELEVIVGVISAMGTGTDGLQEVCWNVSWLDYDDDASNNTQGIGRLDRLGQSKQVVTRSYLSDKTIDVGFYGAQMTKVLALEASLKNGG